VRFPRLGLRAQIVLALCAVFALSFSLAGYATLQLARRSGALEHERTGRALARSLAVGLEQHHDTSNAGLRRYTRGMAQRVPIVGLRFVRTDGSAFEWGVREGRATATTGLADGRLAVWLPPPHPRAAAPFAALLIVYLVLTGIAVLVFAYIALTYLIVRPLDELTLSAEQLPARGELIFASAGGSAEAVRLARAWNEMAIQLRAERRRLVDRLAELERTTEELKSTQTQLIHGEKLASIGRLAAGVAHEIGNPLAAILGLLELLRAGDLSETETREFLARIQSETERIHRIIGDLLDYARRDVDADGLHQTADLREVIGDAVNLVRPQKQSKDVSIEVTIDPRTRRVVGPQHRLTQVVLNLLLNALDALGGRGGRGGRGRIEIRVAPAAVAVGGEPQVVVTIDDDGPGIAADMLDKLFDPFTTSKPPGEGTGLGLAVSHAIVDSLSGTISARNRDSGGASFELRLREARAASAPPAAV
jgi:two-component system, NtrC family, sensor kinase